MKKKVELCLFFIILCRSLGAIPVSKFISPAEISPVLYQGQALNRENQVKFEVFLNLVNELKFLKAEEFLIKNREIPGFKLNLALLYYYAGADHSSRGAVIAFINTVSEDQVMSMLKLLSRRGQKTEVIYFCDISSYVPSSCTIDLDDENQYYPSEIKMVEVLAFISDLRAKQESTSILRKVSKYPSGKAWLIKYLLQNGEKEMALDLYNIWTLENSYSFEKIKKVYYNPDIKREQSSQILLTVD